MVAKLVRFVRWTIRRMEKLLKVLQAHCSHPDLTYTQDAFDFQYECTSCDKRWFNEVPKLVRTVMCNGRTFQLDGKGKAKEINKVA